MRVFIGLFLILFSFDALAGSLVDVRPGVLGNFKINNFNDGQNANANTFWAGDGHWKSIAGSALNQAQTLNFYSNRGANIDRLADRLFIGGAVPLDGTTTSSGTWLDIVACTNSCAAAPFYQLVVEDENLTGFFGGGGIFDAVHACTVGGGGGCLTGSLIALFPMAYNNGAGGDAWAMYIEAYRTGNVSATWVCECALINLGNLTTVDAYGLVGGGTQQTINHQIECGNNVLAGTTPCSAAIDIINAGSPFNAGLIIANNSIQSYHSIFHAIELPQGYQIVWFSSSNVESGEIWMGPGGNLNIAITGTQINFNGAAGATCGPTTTSASFQVSGGIVIHC